MPNYDDIFQNARGADEPEADSGFDIDKWKADKQSAKAAVYELMDKTADSMVSGDGRLKAYLDTQARFIHYSAGNVLLIMAQKPEATQIGDFDYWKSRNARIRKNEKSVSILEPSGTYEKDDGTTGISYAVKKVFDVSQTSRFTRGQSLNTPDERMLLKALVHSSPVPIELTDGTVQDSGAIYDADKKVIYVEKGMAAPDIFRALSAEICRAASHGKDGPETALCASYILCKMNGIDHDTFFLGSMKDRLSLLGSLEIREALSDIRAAANTVAEKMNDVLVPDREGNGKSKEKQTGAR